MDKNQAGGERMSSSLVESLVELSCNLLTRDMIDGYLKVLTPQQREKYERMLQSRKGVIDGHDKGMDSAGTGGHCL